MSVQLLSATPLYAEARVGGLRLTVTCWVPGADITGAIAQRDRLVLTADGQREAAAIVALPVHVVPGRAAVTSRNGVTEIVLERERGP